MSAMSAVDHHSAKLNGIKLHWVTAGSGPPVYVVRRAQADWLPR